MSDRILKFFDRHFFTAVALNGVFLAIFFNFWLGFAQTAVGVIAILVTLKEVGNDT